MSNPNGWGDGSVNNNIGWGQCANNSTGWGKSQLSSWSGATDIDGGDLPTNSIAPAITGTAQEGQTLTCSTGTWSGSPTYAYQWKRNGNNIGGATSSTYLLVTADVGQSILCTVTATNFVGSATANSNTVTPTSSVDADAQAFITAASITDPTQQSAINQLVVDLKGYNIWTKFKAIYPIVGGTASSHKWNLKDPRDLDAAFRLTFSTGWTHSSNGMTPANAFADTFLNPATIISNSNDGHLSYYSRTNNSGINQIEIGNRDSASSFDLVIKFGSGNLAGACINMSDTNVFTNTTDSTGFYHANQNNTPNIRKMFKNGLVLSTQNVLQNAQPSLNVFIGARNINNSADFYSNRQTAFASIGNGLTDTEASNFYTAVQAYQTTLGRQV